MNGKHQIVHHETGSLTKFLLEPHKVNGIDSILQKEKLRASDLLTVHMVS